MVPAESAVDEMPERVVVAPPRTDPEHAANIDAMISAEMQRTPSFITDR